mmetsp:Transcript_14441/g.33931  ORF Transcript_14441/g.33931 Transcript_14441/m.33931 type:complete len:463 (+) Transcript_14441:2556-3944(+)
MSSSGAASTCLGAGAASPAMKSPALILTQWEARSASVSAPRQLTTRSATRPWVTTSTVPERGRWWRSKWPHALVVEDTTAAGSSASSTVDDALAPRESANPWATADEVAWTVPWALTPTTARCSLGWSPHPRCPWRAGEAPMAPEAASRTATGTMPRSSTQLDDASGRYHTAAGWPLSLDDVLVGHSPRSMRKSGAWGEATAARRRLPSTEVRRVRVPSLPLVSASSLAPALGERSPSNETWSKGRSTPWDARRMETWPKAPTPEWLHLEDSDAAADTPMSALPETAPSWVRTTWEDLVLSTSRRSEAEAMSARSSSAVSAMPADKMSSSSRFSTSRSAVGATSDALLSLSALTASSAATRTAAWGEDMRASRLTNADESPAFSSAPMSATVRGTFSALAWSNDCSSDRMAARCLAAWGDLLPSRRAPRSRRPGEDMSSSWSLARPATEARTKPGAWASSWS